MATRSGTDTRTSEALLDAIYADPRDREARLVYGDLLQERGDPRGELIVLQLREPKTPEQAAREAELVEAYSESWLGRLATITTWVEYELGFLARCGLGGVPEWAIGLREWATVTHVGISESWTRLVAALVTHPAMKSLESLRVRSHALEAMLGATERSPIRRLTIDGALDRARWDRLSRAPVFAALDEIDVRGNLDSDFASSRYTRVAFERRGWSIAWHRGTDERLSALVVRPASRKAAIGELVRYLESLPDDVVSAIDLPPHDGAARHALRRQVRVAGDL